MKVLFYFLIIAMVASLTQAAKIRTRVWIRRSREDQAGPSNEMVTTISESGNGQTESATEEVSVLSNSNFGSTGLLLADQTFDGIPTAIRVRVIEDDGPTSRDDGVCNVQIKTTFTTTPIEVECLREKLDGPVVVEIIKVRVELV